MNYPTLSALQVALGAQRSPAASMSRTRVAMWVDNKKQALPTRCRAGSAPTRLRDDDPTTAQVQAWGQVQAWVRDPA